MKYSVKAIVFFNFIAIGSNILSYAFYYDKGMRPELPGGVDIYVDRNPNKFKSYLDKLGLSSTIVDIIDKVGKGGATLGTILSGPTGGVSAIIGGVAGILGSLAKPINAGILPLVRGKTWDAFHENIMPGNNGRGAEWNWESIKRRTGVAEGNPMYFWITQHGKLLPLYQGIIPSNSSFDFSTSERTTKLRDPKTGKVEDVKEYYAWEVPNGAAYRT